MSPCRVAGSHRRKRLGSTLCLSHPDSACLLAESQLAPQNKAWVQVLPLSTRFSISPRLVAGSKHRTMLRSTPCLSPPSSAGLLAETRALTASQGLGSRFAFLLQAERFSLPSRRLEPQDRAWVYALLLSTWLNVYPRRFAGSHSRTRLGSTLFLSPSNSACLLA